VLWIGRHERRGDSWTIASPDRIAAFRRAVRQANIVGREWFVAHDLPYFPQIDRHIEAYRSALANGLPLEPTTTAILCYNDTMALALYSVLAERGLKVPGDVSVIGFDDLHATYAIPPLTSISHMLPRMGEEAVDLVLEAAEAGDEAGPRVRTVSAQLVIRRSTGAARPR
jgi:DNA-binding LacI/PurR family transcriptional regulator